MEKISTKLVLDLIEESIKNGTSRQVKVEDSEMSYFRMLVSRYNKVNNAKISVKRVHGVYREVCAPRNRFFDDSQYKPVFDLVQNVLNDESAILNEDQLKLIQDKLHHIMSVCQDRCIINNEVEVGNDLLG